MNTKEIATSQFCASLEMLKEAITRCPQGEWTNPEPKNKFWHIAYHTLFYTHMYLQESEKQYVPWDKHREQYQFMGPLPWPPHNVPVIGEPYTKDEVIEYWNICRKQVQPHISSLDLEAGSGFPWLPFNKLELQFYTIRHIQHHTGALIDRLRTRHNIGIAWVRMMASEQAP